jgi:hypothetical protein
MEHTCLCCGGKWKGKVENPRRCALCKTRQWKIGYNHKCEICKRMFFNIYVHHINGNPNDTRKENEIRVCADCHTMIHNPEVTVKKNNHHRRVRDYNNAPVVLSELNKYREKWLKIYN